jgi:hypothetical protein
MTKLRSHKTYRDGFAPGANGSPALRPSGVLPVFLPYTTFEVIVNTH